MNFDDQPGTETFRRTIPARRMQEFNVDQFVTGNRQMLQFVSALQPLSLVQTVGRLHTNGRKVQINPLGQTCLTEYFPALHTEEQQLQHFLFPVQIRAITGVTLHTAAAH